MNLEAHNRFGGSFLIEAESDERKTILDAIADVGIQGVDEERMRREPALGAGVVRNVSCDGEWSRETLAIVEATLKARTEVIDPKVLAARAVLAIEIQTFLEAHPRQ